MAMADHGVRQIIQIIPAPGWYAAFNDIEAGEQFYAPLACWALIAGDASQFVSGMVAEEKNIIACQEDANFSHYLYQTDFDRINQNQEPP
jgi:hypothetical protein